MELVRTHQFMRKHATGKAKIELHVLNVERGLSWEGAQEKWEMLTGSEEGFYLSQQVSTTQLAKIRKKKCNLGKPNFFSKFHFSRKTKNLR